MNEILEHIWAKLTEDNPACSCCSGDDEYIYRVNEVGAMIDGRRWERSRSNGRYEYETIPGEAS